MAKQSATTNREGTPAKDNSDPAPDSAPKSKESKSEDTEKKPGPSNEQQKDLERGSGQAGNSAKARSWWHKTR
jgi:hypothetical protein